MNAWMKDKSTASKSFAGSRQFALPSWDICERYRTELKKYREARRPGAYARRTGRRSAFVVSGLGILTLAGLVFMLSRQDRKKASLRAAA
jgi:hypothetical protein